MMVLSILCVRGERSLTIGCLEFSCEQGIREISCWLTYLGRIFCMSIFGAFCVHVDEVRKHILNRGILEIF